MPTTQIKSAHELRQCAEEKSRFDEESILQTLSLDDAKQLLHELRVHQIELEMQNEELRKTEQQLDGARSRYFDLYDLAPVGYLTISENGIVQEANLTAATMLHLARRMLVKQPINSYIFAEDKEIYCLKRKIIFSSTEPLVWEMRMVRSDGALIWVQAQAAPGRNSEFWITLTDITERKRAEDEKLALQRQFQQSQKLESLGVLAGGIAHDFNNILTIIICNCSMIKKRPQMTEELVSEIETAAERAADLCRQMLAYAGKTQSVPTQVKMTSLVNDMVKMLRSTINQNVTITLDHGIDVPSIKADVGQLRQIVMNLIINASEAISDGRGEIRVSVLKTAIMPGLTEVDHLGNPITPGAYILLEVSDNGCGMLDETLSHIFEPFYTTKFSGRGLGMSAVLGIISAHGGALQLSSQLGEGTTFKVYLPIQSNDFTAEIPVQQIAAKEWRGSGTILLVEDETMVLQLAKTMLQLLGFTVIEAENGKVALEMYRKNVSGINLVITDIGMPDMDGYELFRELKKLNPGLPIIISSGFGDADVSSKISGGEVAGYLTKPYNFDQMHNILKKVVEGLDKTD